MSKFRVGDRVICVKDNPVRPEGFIGVVQGINSQLFGGKYPIIVVSDYGDIGQFKEDELELLSSSVETTPIEGSKVKSDGGSSSYYELTITNKAGESIKCETGDVIRALVGNDFDFGNCVKALRRMYLATLGKGKEGTDIAYDCNKVRYFLSEIERVNK